MEKKRQRKIENLEIDRIWINRHEVCPNGVIGFDWSCNVGFGEYILHLGDDGLLHADSECMDGGEDKAFIREILSKLVEKIVIDG